MSQSRRFFRNFVICIVPLLAAVAALIIAQQMQPAPEDVITFEAVATQTSPNTNYSADVEIQTGPAEPPPCDRQMPGIVKIPGCPPAPDFYATLPPGVSP